MAGDFPWYAGRCVRRHDVIAIEVIAHKAETGWVPVENAQKLFPKSGEIEARGAATKALRSGEWIAFTAAAREPKGRGPWKVARHRRLLHFSDLSHLESLDAARRLFTVDGWPTSQPPGAWGVRISQGEVVQLELDRGGEGTLRAPNASKVPIFRFDQTAVIEMPVGANHVPLYDVGLEVAARANYDWSPEVDYVAHVVRSMGGADDSRIGEIIAWLELHADAATGRLSASGSDPTAAYEKLRSGELAKRLASDQDLLREYAKALSSDAKIARLVQAAAVSIAEEERGAIRVRAESQFAQEFEGARRTRFQALDVELRAHDEKKREEIETRLSLRESKIRAEIESRLATRSAEVDQALAKRKTNGKAEIDRTLNAQKAVIETEVSDLTQKRDLLNGEIHVLDGTSKELTANIALLHGRETAAAANLDRVLAAVAATEPSLKRGAVEVVVPLRRPTRGRVVVASELKQTIKSCALLTDRGKALMEQFVALLLAGDVPVLIGPDVSDFLLVAETLLSSGASARLEADPTVITFEDVWVRAGTSTATVLAQALQLASGDDPATMLAVIEEAERSGARFWFPSLAERARRGDLPRRLLLCVTVEDDQCEESRALLSHAVRLVIESAISDGASAIAVVALGSSEHRELDPGKRPTDIIEGMRTTTQLGKGLGISKSIRAARAAVEASRMTSSKAEAQAVALAVARLFIDPMVEESQSPAILARRKINA